MMNNIYDLFIQLDSVNACGGTIIGKNKLVTAAHCYHKDKTGYYAIGQKYPNASEVRRNENTRFDTEHWAIHPHSVKIRNVIMNY